MATYRVRPGDSWAKIAGQELGNQRFFQELMKANPGIGVLQPGMTISLPSVDTGKQPNVTVNPQDLDADITDALGRDVTLRGLNPYSGLGNAIFGGVSSLEQQIAGQSPADDLASRLFGGLSETEYLNRYGPEGREAPTVSFRSRSTPGSNVEVGEDLTGGRSTLDPRVLARTQGRSFEERLGGRGTYDPREIAARAEEEARIRNRGLGGYLAETARDVGAGLGGLALDVAFTPSIFQALTGTRLTSAQQSQVPTLPGLIDMVRQELQRTYEQAIAPAPEAVAEGIQPQRGQFGDAVRLTAQAQAEYRSVLQQYQAGNATLEQVDQARKRYLSDFMTAEMGQQIAQHFGGTGSEVQFLQDLGYTWDEYALGGAGAWVKDDYRKPSYTASSYGYSSNGGYRRGTGSGRAARSMFAGPSGNQLWRWNIRIS